MTLAAEPSSVTDHKRPCRRNLFPLLVLAASLSAPATLGATQVTDDLFQKYEVVTGEAAERQTVLSGFFLGGATAELAVVQIADNGDRRLRMYGFDGDTWVSVLDAILDPEVLFVDVANIGGHDRLITYESGRLNWFDPETATERVLVEVAASYRATDDGEIPHLDVTRDLNHDGRDDLVMPEVDGFWISTQSSDGSFTSAVKLGPPEPFAEHSVGHLDVGEPAADDSRSYGDVGITAATIPVYLSRIHQMDFDQDGRSDLVFWNEDHFEVYLQNPSGQFSAEAETFTTGVPLYGDGAYSRALDYSDEGVLSILFGSGKKTERTVLHSLRDLNGDGVADLVTLTLAGRSISRQRSLYEVHFGKLTPDGIEFTSDIGMTIQPGGKAGAMQPWGYASQWIDDFDGDGQVDILFRDVAVGMGGMMRALVGNSVPINLEFYCGKDGSYPDKPTTRRKIRRFAPFAGLGNVFFPAILIGDVNGDGRSDLLVGRSPEELHVFLGVSGPDLLARQPQKVAVAVPFNERNTRLVDLNRDGKQDVLMHHAPTKHAPSEPHRVTLLIAR